MSNRNKLHKDLTRMIDEVNAMKKYLHRQNYFGTIEQMLFTMHERVTKAHALLIKTQEDQIVKDAFLHIRKTEGAK